MFKGTLKQVVTSKASDDFQNLMNTCFPTFSNAIDFSELMRKSGVEMVISSTSIQETRIGRYRRYAGGSDLAGGCYYSVCKTDDGNDNGTMTSELHNYWNPNSGLIPMLLDSTVVELPQGFLDALADKDSQLDSQAPCLVLVAHRLDSNFDLEQENPLSNAVAIEACNLHIDSYEIDHVYDLRRSNYQEHFLNTLCKLECSPSEQTEIMISKELPNNFLEIIPSLVIPEVGGSSFHDAIGIWMRFNGYNGLIFPSARRDCLAVEVGDDEDFLFDGWNFVDYRDAGQPEDEPQFGLLPKWITGENIGAEIKPVAQVSQGDRTIPATGFYMEGVQTAEAAFTKKRLEVILAGGEDPADSIFLNRRGL